MGSTFFARPTRRGLGVALNRSTSNAEAHVWHLYGIPHLAEMQAYIANRKHLSLQCPYLFIKTAKFLPVKNKAQKDAFNFLGATRPQNPSAIQICTPNGLKWLLRADVAAAKLINIFDFGTIYQEIFFLAFFVGESLMDGQTMCWSIPFLITGKQRKSIYSSPKT